MQRLFITFADLECLLKKMGICHNDDPERSSTTKKNEHTPYVYTLFI